MKQLIPKLIGAYLNTVALVAPSYTARKGFELFCYPFRVKLTEKQKEFFNTADKIDFSFDDHKIHGYRWGYGDKKILFLHGWQSHTYRWKTYIDALPKDQYTIYSLDAPGHGLSEGKFLSVPLYSKVIHHVLNVIGDVHAIVGHSLGGFSMLYTLYQYPLLSLQKLILLAPPGEASDFIKFYEQSLGLRAYTKQLIVDHFENTFQVKPDFFSAPKFAASVKVPGLIIHDEGDPEAPYHYASQIQVAWKRSKLITTKGFGHNLRSPDVVKDVVNFIAEEAIQLKAKTQISLETR